MKKLAIFGLALVLVFGMSAMAMAATEAGSIDGTNDVTDTLDVNVTVAKYATASFDQNTALILNEITNPNVDNDGEGTGVIGYTVASNCPVDISVSGEISNTGLTLYKDIDSGESDSSKINLSANTTSLIGVAAGSNTKDLALDADVTAGNWYDVNADSDTDDGQSDQDAYSATLTLTVAAN
jgi:hypothetical protein